MCWSLNWSGVIQLQSATVLFSRSVNNCCWGPYCSRTRFAVLGSLPSLLSVKNTMFVGIVELIGAIELIEAAGRERSGEILRGTLHWSQGSDTLVSWPPTVVRSISSWYKRQVFPAFVSSVTRCCVVSCSVARAANGSLSLNTPKLSPPSAKM